MIRFNALLPISAPFRISAPPNVFLLISAPIPLSAPILISAILKIHWNKQHFYVSDTVEAFGVEID